MFDVRGFRLRVGYGATSEVRCELSATADSSYGESVHPRCISAAPAAFDRTPSRLNRPCRSSQSLHSLRLPPTQSYSEILREQAGMHCLRRTTAWQANRRDRRRKEKEKWE